MTTAPHRPESARPPAEPCAGSRSTPSALGAELLGPGTATALVGLAGAALGALVGGAPAATGAGLGAAMVLVVFSFGAVTVGLVAMVAPAVSLVVALLTYTLQVVLVAVVYLALSRGGALDGPVDARWLSGAVIAGTLVWTTAQIVVTTRSRRPIYDLPEQGPEASDR